MGEKLSRLWFTAPAEKQSADKGQTVNEIPINEIEPNPFQPRKIFAPEQLAELSESIKNYGLLQPVLVRRINGRYQLISGEETPGAHRCSHWIGKNSGASAGIIRPRSRGNGAGRKFIP